LGHGLRTPIFVQIAEATLRCKKCQLKRLSKLAALRTTFSPDYAKVLIFSAPLTWHCLFFSPSRMRKLFSGLAALALLASHPALAQGPTAASADPAQWVNPLIGTDSKPSLSNGNTYPAIALPWGMNFWMPQTGKMGDGWAYQYGADKIRGFKQTHQPSPWMNDYGQFAIMPITGKRVFEQDARASWYSHKAEVAEPNYYRVYLADHDVTTEIAPTERAASFRFTFPKTDSAYVVLDAFDKGSHVQVLPQQRRIVGYTTRNSSGVPKNFKNYFILEFDHDFASTVLYQDQAAAAAGVLDVTANHAGAIVGFRTRKGERVNVRVASSFISPEQAVLNLKELGASRAAPPGTRP
jgi:predicted alpha-1,2-mannosidase